MDERKDFSNRKYFPGTSGNPFDRILHQTIALETTSGLLFSALLLALAFLPGLILGISALRLFWCGLLWLFMLGDWALLAALPRFGKSFGPAKPPSLSLAIMRLAIALLPPWLSFPLQVVGTGLVVYGFWIEPHTIRLTRQQLTTRKTHFIPPLRILHIGDLHVERLTGREQQLKRIITETRPDLILFSGDLLNLSYLHDAQAHLDLREILSSWSAPLGVYAVSGSPAVDLPELIPDLLHGLPIHFLQGEKVTLCHAGQQFDLVGLSCTHKPFEDGPTLSRLVDPLHTRWTILLYHSPDLAPEAAEAGIDLQLSGHTHGGQVRLPLIGALLTGSLYGKRFEAGRQQIGGLTLYITRGIGLEGAAAPRVRFLCPPEIILWDIV